MRRGGFCSLSKMTAQEIIIWQEIDQVGTLDFDEVTKVRNATHERIVTSERYRQFEFMDVAANVFISRFGTQDRFLYECQFQTGSESPAARVFNAYHSAETGSEISIRRERSPAHHQHSTLRNQAVDRSGLSCKFLDFIVSQDTLPVSTRRYPERPLSALDSSNGTRRASTGHRAPRILRAKLSRPGSAAKSRIPTCLSA
jgi:hypothetical protein